MNRILLLASFLSLGGCGSTLLSPPPLPSEFTAPCEAIKPIGANDFQTVEVWMLKSVEVSKVCAEKHKALVDAVKRRDELFR